MTKPSQDDVLRVMRDDELIYDWNNLDRPGPVIHHEITFFDETLRDGLQCPSVTDPAIDVKLQIVHLMDKDGVQYADIGLPGAGPRATADVTRIVEEIRDAKLNLKPAAAGRTHVNDLKPIAEISQKTGVEIEVMAFIGSSPIRQYAESWDLDRMMRMSAEAIDFCVKNNLPVTYVTEDTIRSRPDTLRDLFRVAIDHGATRLCLCDTVGHASPDGLTHLIRFTRSLLRAWNSEHIGVDWHGHNDRGLGVCNNIFALEAGADRVHGTFLGVGERVGNASLDQTLINLKLMGEIRNDLTHLREYCELVSEHYGVPIPISYPMVGRDAFRTATGVHAAAIIKAEHKGDAWLADRIYSGVPAGMIGREQTIEVGPMSGESNVIYWLRKRNIEPTPHVVQQIFQAAKQADHVFTEEEISALLNQA